MTDHSQDAVVARLDNIKFALQRQNMDTFGVPGCRYIGSDEITRLELEALQPGDQLPGGLVVMQATAIKEAVAAEREACAKVADPPLWHRKGKPGLWRLRRAKIAAAIRSRTDDAEAKG